MNDFDTLFVVSDLHLGGTRHKKDPTKNFQIFNQGEALGGLIEHAAQQPGQVGLVLNGDVVDFLAEDNASYLAPLKAPARLKRIMSDPSFSPVWQALQQFVATPDKELILVLGNHDVELALPRVQDTLLAELTQGKADALGRIRFETSGAGYACTVGGRRVLCLHGNEVDDWNVVDYRQLLEVARAQNRGMRLPPWTPNAGTKLVIDLMNRAKRDHPFVDLLKPETTMVPGVLLAIKPDLKDELKSIGPVLLRLAKDYVRIATGVLGAEEDEEEVPPQIKQDGFGRSLAAPNRTRSGGPASDAFYSRLEKQFEAGTELDELAEEGTLGFFSISVRRWLGLDTEEALRDSLRDWLAKAPVFELDYRDDTFKKLDKAVGPEVDFLVAGHTHLERSLPRSEGGHYFNSGTWIRLMRVEQAVLDDDAEYQNLLKILRSNQMDVIDASPYKRQINTVVQIQKQGGKVRGELFHVVFDKGKFKPDPVPGSESEI